MSTFCRLYPYRIDAVEALPASFEKHGFTPRYPIEVTPGGALVIPQTFSGAIPRGSRFGLARRTAKTRPIYVFRCPLCGKEFSRSTYDAALRSHKNKSGWEFYGTYGTYVRTKY